MNSSKVKKMKQKKKETIQKKMNAQDIVIVHDLAKKNYSKCMHFQRKLVPILVDVFNIDCSHRGFFLCFN